LPQQFQIPGFPNLFPQASSDFPGRLPGLPTREPNVDRESKLNSFFIMIAPSIDDASMRHILVECAALQVQAICLF
jgi:hypothetical protein